MQESPCLGLVDIGVFWLSDCIGGDVAARKSISFVLFLVKPEPPSLPEKTHTRARESYLHFIPYLQRTLSSPLLPLSVLGPHPAPFMWPTHNSLLLQTHPMPYPVIEPQWCLNSTICRLRFLNSKTLLSIVQHRVNPALSPVRLWSSSLGDDRADPDFHSRQGHCVFQCRMLGWLRTCYRSANQLRRVNGINCFVVFLKGLAFYLSLTWDCITEDKSEWS